MKKIFLALALIFLFSGCADNTPTNEMSTELPKTWIEDYWEIYEYYWNNVWDTSSYDFDWNELYNIEREMQLSEFPGVTFTWRPSGVWATDRNGTRFLFGDGLFGGVIFNNVFLEDLTGDGVPDFAATITVGSGIIENRVRIYDFVNNELFELADRFSYDYDLSIDNGELIVTRTNFGNREIQETGKLAIIDGTLIMVVAYGGDEQ